MSSPSPVQPGDVLAGKYRVDRVLGAGAMGVVVAATHLELGSRVALKFMLPAALRGEDGVQRFMREARAAGKLSSDHVCRVVDVGRLDNQAPYIVMEYLEGRDFSELLAAKGVLSPAAASHYLIQVCEAMAEAHAVGIVHRDLKPQNLFVTRKRSGAESVKVLDFGISKATGVGDMAATGTGALMGSPAYMSPEQVKSSKHVDGRSDLWSLGVILYQATVGRLPFVGDEVYALITGIVTETPPRPRELRPELPEAFEAVILRCLEKDLDRRYATAEELAADLAPFAASAPPPRAATPPPSNAFDRTQAPMVAPSRGGTGGGTVGAVGNVAETRAPGVPPMASTPGAPGLMVAPPVAGRSTLGGAASEAFAAPTSTATGTHAAKARRKWIFAGAGGVAAAGVAVVVMMGGHKGSTGGATPAGAQASPALVDEGRGAQAPPDAGAAVGAIAPSPAPQATPPDAGVAVVVATPEPPVGRGRPRRPGDKPKPVEKPAETKPAETKPAETKPVEKPVETKPVETKPVEKRKPREEDEFSN